MSNVQLWGLYVFSQEVNMFTFCVEQNKFSSHNLPNYAVEDIGWRVQSTMFKAWLHFKRTHKEPRDKATLNI